MNQFHIHSLYISLIFKTQINLMQFLKEFKVSEIISVVTFDIISTSTFETKCLHHTIPWKHPKLFTLLTWPIDDS
jgi:hypothetical protein